MRGDIRGFCGAHECVRYSLLRPKIADLSSLVSDNSEMQQSSLENEVKCSLVISSTIKNELRVR
jgi:hypothetical protein